MASCSEPSETNSTIMEFAVRMQSASDEVSVRNKLEVLEGVSSVIVDLSKESVLVRSTLSSFRVQELLDSTGLLVVLRGYNHSSSETPVEAGVVTMQSGHKIAGLTRLLQGEGVCLVEGSLSGLSEGEYKLEVHEKGDLTRGCDSCGEVFGKGMRTCGVVARSSGVFGNRKKVCQCSGQTIWEEAVQAKQERIKSSL